MFFAFWCPLELLRYPRGPTESSTRCATVRRPRCRSTETPGKVSACRRALRHDTVLGLTGVIEGLEPLLSERAGRMAAMAEISRRPATCALLSCAYGRLPIGGCSLHTLRKATLSRLWRWSSWSICCDVDVAGRSTFLSLSFVRRYCCLSVSTIASKRGGNATPW